MSYLLVYKRERDKLPVDQRSRIPAPHQALHRVRDSVEVRKALFSDEKVETVWGPYLPHEAPTDEGDLSDDMILTEDSPPPAEPARSPKNSAKKRR